MSEMNRELFFGTGEDTTEPVIALSPMAGFSDSPYRQICRELGSAMSITEFVPATGILSDDSERMLEYTENERPVVFQVFGNNEEEIIAACEKASRKNPDGFELNMGCSTRKVSLRGSGAGLLREPKKAQSIVQKMVSTLSVPVSAKIRLGWDIHSRNYREIARRLEDAGVSFLTVHGRTKEMGYSGEADWNAIGEVAAAASIPVFGNGDIQSYHEAVEKIQIYGLAGALIGRAARGNPWIFSGKCRSQISLRERVPLILKHFELMRGFYDRAESDSPPAVILFRKHLKLYMSEIPNMNPYEEDYIRSLLNMEDPELLSDRLIALAERNSAKAIA